MRRTTFPSLIALLLAVISMPGDASAQGKLGTAEITGSVLIDGKPATGSTPIGPAARIASGADSTVTLKLAGGGEVRFIGQADLIVADRGNSVYIQLICGEITVNTNIQAMVASKEGGRMQVTAGQGTIMPAAGKSINVKQGKIKDFGPGEAVTSTGLTSTMTVTSKMKCDCNCP